MKTAVSIVALTTCLNVAADVSYQLGVTSDYVFRGISSNSEKPALQGGISAEINDHWNAGIWASEVDFDGLKDGYETDFYVAYSNDFSFNSNTYDYSIGVTQYEYSNDVADDYTELNLSISTRVPKLLGRLTLAANHTEDLGEDFSGDKIEYGDTSLRYDTRYLPYAVAIHAVVGQGKFNSRMVDESYTYYNIGLTRELCTDLDLSVDYYNTNENIDIMDERVVASLNWQI